ncbi:MULTISPECIES: class I SAM-dependent methyltransferase [Bacillaceae]|uniref:Methyltransferase domain-containing protein n=1 Tax=Evansella alkalicola TaxID=745819 RepID=A0ABS6JR24_9BACI|nr:MULTISPECIES: methyltransferase domain-containing protein [Bacillaceae]MBU9720933.1 methyltransferase domain-containing protein [Bacillus alkalicola]
MSTKEYIKNIFKDPKIASITPTSQSCVAEICKRIDFEKRLVIIEYGPATGVFTEYLLNHLTDDSLIIAVELNPNFANYLGGNIQDHRLKVHQGNAEFIDKIMEDYDEEVDYVLSGIPFSLMTHNGRLSVVQKTHKLLKKGGKFLPYQTFFQRDEHLLHYLYHQFPEVNDNYLFRNIPPMRIYEAIK